MKPSKSVTAKTLNPENWSQFVRSIEKTSVFSKIRQEDLPKSFKYQIEQTLNACPNNRPTYPLKILEV